MVHLTSSSYRHDVNDDNDDNDDDVDVVVVERWQRMLKSGEREAPSKSYRELEFLQKLNNTTATTTAALTNLSIVSIKKKL